MSRPHMLLQIYISNFYITCKDGFLGTMLLVILSWWRRALQDQALNLGESMPLRLVLKMKAMETTLSRLQVHYLVHACGAFWHANISASCLCTPRHSCVCVCCLLACTRMRRVCESLHLHIGVHSQGVTRVDDPVASIDLCQELEAEDQAAAAGMIPVLPVLSKVPM